MKGDRGLHWRPPRRRLPILRYGLYIFLLSMFATAFLTMLVVCCGVSVTLYFDHWLMEITQMLDAMVVTKPAYREFDIKVTH
jgi:hypothetical protein